MKNFFSNEFFKNALVQWIFLGSILVNIADWAFVGFFIRPVDFSIILHYNVYFGVDLIGPWWQVYMLPFIGLLVILFNLGFGYFFFQKKERILTHLLLLGAFICQICISIAVAGLLLINY